LDDDRIFIGVLRVVLHIPGARSLKEGRQVAHSLRDRVRHRFDVSVHEVEPSENHTRRVLLVTTGGNDSRAIASTLDRVRAFLEGSGDAMVAHVDVEVFRWHASLEEQHG
jgi:uncharacterized protein YlxP (DUF503 family)